ncbi:hypothetical protein HanPSC8_Chr10g0436841 [Helianthus annuus]|nr:hypothetical protein HanPSC8_Chr10g0436841 [Helianthus annuus]
MGIRMDVMVFMSVDVQGHLGNFMLMGEHQQGRHKAGTYFYD